MAPRLRPGRFPPRLAAYYHESWDSGTGGWETWLKATHSPSNGPVGGYVSLAEPSKHDHNHDDGIGTLHLVKFLYPGPMNKNCVSLGGGDPDLRDAKVSLWARGRDYSRTAPKSCGGRRARATQSWDKLRDGAGPIGPTQAFA